MNFQIELHNFCNFSCGYCPNHIMKRERTFMSEKVFDTILHNYIIPYKDVNVANSNSPPTFIGHKDSEPLIGKAFTHQLRSLADVAPDMKIDIYSNGVLLPIWRDRGRDFMDFLGSLPNRVRYLMSFHPVNHDYSQNDYTTTVKYLQDVLRNRRPPNVEFITVSHRSKWVSDAVQESWRKTWEGYPITVHANCSINPWTGLMDEVATCAHNGCPYSDFGHWFFGVTGNVIACCMDLEEEIVLGNVMRDDPAKMFRAAEAFYAEQRRILTAGELHPRGVCRNCFGQKRDTTELLQLGIA